MSDFKAIGKAFVDFYYNKFDTGPREGVAVLYVISSKNCFPLFLLKFFSFEGACSWYDEFQQC